MDVWYVYVFIPYLCCPVFRLGPCVELITRPRSPTVCTNYQESEKSAPCSKVGARMSKKNSVTCQPFVGLRNGAWLGSRPVDNSSAQPR
jgi:hypothetical protein